MPRWARFVSCSITGLLITVPAFLLAAYWVEGGPRYWAEVLEFVSTPAFWSLLWLLGLMASLTLVLARIAIHIYGLSGGLAGLLCGAAVALAYTAFLVSAHAPDWGGAIVGLKRASAGGALFAAALAVSGLASAWLWDRLE